MQNIPLILLVTLETALIGSTLVLHYAQKFIPDARRYITYRIHSVEGGREERVLANKLEQAESLLRDTVFILYLCCFFTGFYILAHL